MSKVLAPIFYAWLWGQKALVVLVTVDTGKVAAPLEDEASSLGFSVKLSGFAKGAASVDQGSEGKSDDQPHGSQDHESQDQSGSSQVLSQLLLSL